MFTISIGKAEATCADKVTLTSGMVKAVRVAFVFSEEWEGFDKVAVFSNGTTTLDVSLDEDNTCYIPHEMTTDAGRDVMCGVYGCKGEGSERVAIPTVKCLLGKVVEGVNPSGDEPTEPTPTIWEEILIKMDESVRNPYFTEDVKLTGITTVEEAYEGASWVNDNSIGSADATFTINIQGDVKFECKCEGEPYNYTTFYVDGEMIAQCTDGDTYSFEGKVNQNIQVECHFMDIRFSEFIKKVYVADVLSDIDTALDSILAIQESIVGGVEL